MIAAMTNEAMAVSRVQSHEIDSCETQYAEVVALETNDRLPSRDKETALLASAKSRRCTMLFMP
jgi:hypothetical protein